MRSDIQQDPVEQLGSLEIIAAWYSRGLSEINITESKYSSLFQENPPELPHTIPFLGRYACRCWKGH